MWESPIKQIAGEIQSQVIKQEDELITQISQEIRYEVDKKELIKALEYDRGQYDKGYKDGTENTLEGVSELIAYYDYEFLQRYYPKECEQGYTLHDLNNKYGLAEILKNWERYKVKLNET